MSATGPPPRHLEDVEPSFPHHAQRRFASAPVVDYQADLVAPPAGAHLPSPDRRHLLVNFLSRGQVSLLTVSRVANAQRRRSL